MWHLIPTPTQFEDQPLHTRSQTSDSYIGQGKSIPESFLALSWPKRLHNNHNKPKCKWTHNNEQRGENNSPGLSNEATGKLQSPKWKKKSDSQPVHKGNRHTYHKSVRKIHAHSRNRKNDRKTTPPTLCVRKNDGESQPVREDCHFQPVCEDEKAWGERENAQCRRGENGICCFPAHAKMESLLVEWACGQGLTVLPPTTS